MSQWFFVRSAEGEDGENRLRKFNTNAQNFTYVQHEQIDFDIVATLLTDRALKTVTQSGNR
jgi:hypothetical protein